MTRADARAFTNRSRHRKKKRSNWHVRFVCFGVPRAVVFSTTHIHAHNNNNTRASLSTCARSVNSSATYRPSWIRNCDFANEPSTRETLRGVKRGSNSERASPRRVGEHCSAARSIDRKIDHRNINRHGAPREERCTMCINIWRRAVIAVAEVSLWTALSRICVFRVLRYPAARSHKSEVDARDCYYFLKKRIFSRSE